MKRVIATSIGAVTIALSLTSCMPPDDPMLAQVLNAPLGELKPFQAKFEGHCLPTEFVCAQPLYEPGFSAPATADPVEICNSVIDLQNKLGFVAYAAMGASAGKVTDLQAVKDFCIEGFTKPYIQDDGTKIYEGTILFDDGQKDGMGKVTSIGGNPTDGYQVVFSFGRNLQRIGWISYGDEPTPRHYGFAPAE